MCAYVVHVYVCIYMYVPVYVYIFVYTYMFIIRTYDVSPTARRVRDQNVMALELAILFSIGFAFLFNNTMFFTSPRTTQIRGSPATLCSVFWLCFIAS